MTAPTSMRNHWWWRPGWREGRRFYTWHLTFEGQEDVHRLAAEYRSALEHLGPALTLIPDQWLHCTMQGIGFVGEITEPSVTGIVDAARERLSGLSAFDIELGPALVDPEAVLIPLQPSTPIQQVRHTVRAAISQVLGDVPENASGYYPHVSLAYSAQDGPAPPVAQAVGSVQTRPARARVTSVQLIVIHRDNLMYEWETFATVPLG
ncbi:2'-5' RNA ligase family protein [Streptomyces griseorubiginosus]|uniref:2'-5' RNA ligase family protein n=1 Tax=Streptomyces griseorubiginosus TaxID=67304 RepID=UPI0036EE11D7